MGQRDVASTRDRGDGQRMAVARTASADLLTLQDHAPQPAGDGAVARCPTTKCEERGDARGV
jgi:hypothetical protein